MEASDVFGSGVEIAEGDPFAGGEDFAGFGETPAPQVAVPVVDREGVPVGGLPTLPADQAAAAGEAYRQEKGEPAPITPPLVSGPPPVIEERFVPGAVAAQPTQQERLRAIAEREAGEREAAEQERLAQAVPAQEQAPVSEPLAPPQTAEVAEVAEAAPVAVAEPTAAPQSAAIEATVAEPEVEEDAPEPVEPTNERGKVTHRRYYVLRATDAGRFEQLSWHEKDGKMVPRGTHGAKRQWVALARGADDALKIGYAALGAPLDGVKIVAVAALHFQVRTVKPKVPEPSRARLEIS